MATLLGLHGKEFGDRYVYNSFKNLSDEWIVYSQPEINYKRERRTPDFVILHQGYGVFVLEVKDWVTILDQNKKEAKIRRNDGHIYWDKSPLEQAKLTMYLIKNHLQESLINRNILGEFNYRFRYGGILIHQKAAKISQLEEVWGDGYLLGVDDLEADNLERKIINIPPGGLIKIPQKHFDMIRSIIDSKNNAKDSRGETKGIYSLDQEKISKELLEEKEQIEHEKPKQNELLSEINPTVEKRMESIENSLPEDVLNMKSNINIRLLRGFAGTGKTDILVLRSYFLHKNYPDKNILVTTFNQPLRENRLIPELAGLPRVEVRSYDNLCNEIYKLRFDQKTAPSPSSTEGTLKKMEKASVECIKKIIIEYGVEFLAKEFIWMKEVDLDTEEKYIETHRIGRGKESNKTLSKQQKKALFNVFREYQEFLNGTPSLDYADLHNNVTNYINEGVRPNKRYDVILVDEAQHFAPKWMTLIKAFLKENGSLFICEDPGQSVYRTYSWKEKGVNVIGRTKWLRTPYRNTKQIFELSRVLDEHNPVKDLAAIDNQESNGFIINTENLREGSMPELHLLPDVNSEIELIQSKVNNLLCNGILPTEIAFLHSKKFVIDRYKRIFHGSKIYIDEVRRNTGMEWKVLFIPDMNNLFTRNTMVSYELDVLDQISVFYTCVTRARDYLFILSIKQIPKEFHFIKKYVDIFPNT